MSTKLKLEMPAEAALRLRDKIVAGDPEGIELLQQFSVEQIVFNVDGKDVTVNIPPVAKGLK